MSPGAAPLRATYRLQLNSSFGFDAARARIPYLRDLGISHLYLSPSLQARPGSTHGYDVVDPTRISADLGGEPGFRSLAAEAHAAGMGIVLDLVPNHMAADDRNRYWADAELRRRFFDIDAVTGRHRRFFDVDELAGVRQEDPEVFEETHALVLSLVGDGVIDALRIDHPDGLADPVRYLERLRQGGAETVWVEKILEPSERLRDWPVAGTVGYEFLNDVCAVFVDPAGEPALTELWQRVSGDRRQFADVAHEAKLEQATGPFRPELERLARTAPDLDADVLARALASLPVYRTYIDPVTLAATEEDRAALSGMEPAVSAMLLGGGARAEFVTRFQQTSPAITAKGVEDTAFYRYGRLLALCDVGGDPGRFGIGVERFHAANSERASRFPEAMLTTMTHDTKRSADVRARIGALSGFAAEWADAVERWFALAEPHRAPGTGPDDAECYFLFQTLAGAWPIEPERLTGYLQKSLREAKRNSSWTEPDTDWEQSVERFTVALLADDRFRAALDPLLARATAAGERAALGQLAVKLTAPGIPDIYQGDELVFRALVDPDNRRPVDWRLYEALLRRMMGGGQPGDATLKLFITFRLLVLRTRRPEAFQAASYDPLDAGQHALAYVRGGDVLTVVSVREQVQGALVGAPRGRWREVLTGEERSFGARVPLAGVLGEHGLAVFERVHTTA